MSELTSELMDDVLSSLGIPGFADHPEGPEARSQIYETWPCDKQKSKVYKILDQLLGSLGVEHVYEGQELDFAKGSLIYYAVVGVLCKEMFKTHEFSSKERSISRRRLFIRAH